MIAVGRPSIGTVRNQRASLGPLDHLGPCLSLRSLVLPPCEDPLLLPNADLRGICACTAAAEVASRGRSTTLPEAVSALRSLIRDQYVTPDAPELRHVIPELILYCCRTLLLALGRRCRRKDQNVALASRLRKARRVSSLQQSHMATICVQLTGVAPVACFMHCALPGQLSLAHALPLHPREDRLPL